MDENNSAETAELSETHEVIINNNTTDNKNLDLLIWFIFFLIISF